MIAAKAGHPPPLHACLAISAHVKSISLLLATDIMPTSRAMRSLLTAALLPCQGNLVSSRLTGFGYAYVTCRIQSPSEKRAIDLVQHEPFNHSKVSA